MVVLVVLAGAAAVRAATLSAPALSAKQILPAAVTVPGPPPSVAWPGQGQAALEVRGVGALGSYGPDSPQPIASLAKVMTAYVILRDHPMGPGQSGFTVNIGTSAVADYQSRLAQAQSVMPVADGEQLSELQLLQGLLVASANNAGPILAQFDAGSEKAFVAKMNRVAQTLGMSRTHYADTSGFDPSTVSTASDQLVLADRAMASPVFARVVDMSSVDLPVAGTMVNFDRAIGTDGFVGIKTGSDSEAGGCFMFANDQTVGHRKLTVLGVVLGLDRGQSSTGSLIDLSIQAATALVRSAVLAAGQKTLLAAGAQVETVTNGDGHRVAVVTASPLSGSAWGGQTYQLSFTGARLGSSIHAGQVLGTVTVDGNQAPAVAASSMPAVTWSWRFSHLF